MADFETLKEWVTASWKAQSKFREEAEEDFSFVDGHQWTDAEKADLEENARVAVVFNRTAVIIGSVAGTEINNRTEVRFIPREMGDVKPNEVLSAGGEWFRDQANAEDADSEAFTDLLVCGLGVTDTTLDFDADEEGEPTVIKMDPLRFGWDHHDHTKGLKAARYFFEVKEMPTSEAKDRFPGKEVSEIHAGWIKTAGDVKQTTNHVDDEFRHGEEDDDENRDSVIIVRVQYRERTRIVEYVNPQTGQKDTMEKAAFDRIIQRVPLNIPSRTINKWEWTQAFLGNDSVLEENQPDPDKSTFNVMTGHWDRKEKRFYGLLRSMKDPQKFANKWLSQTLHIINSNAKGGVMVEEGATDDPVQFEESWSAADGVTWMKPGAIAAGKVMPKPAAQMPQALMALTEFAISAIRDTSGVNLELLGLRDANQPGVLEYQRRQSAMTTLARFFDSLRYYRKMQGITILNMLRNHIAPTGRLVRIMKEDLVQYVPLAMATDTRKYDVIVDDAPQAPNEKEKTWSVIQAMLPILQNADLAMEDWADIIEYSPLPSSFADKVRQKAIEAKNQGPDPMQQLAMADAQAKVKLTEAQAAKAGAEAQAKGGEGQIRQAEHVMQREKIQAERAQTMMSMQEGQIDLAMKARDQDFRRLEMAHEQARWAHDERMAQIKEKQAAQRPQNPAQ